MNIFIATSAPVGYDPRIFVGKDLRFLPRTKAFLA